MSLENRPVVRSVYLRQVQQIFPWYLVGRHAELAELTAFCTQTDGGSYAWWQGPAWAGKSALMASFVLHPPAGVRVVSFFVTARFAGQSDRTAFLEVVLEQLAEIAGQQMPDLTASNQQAWFGQLLHDAAMACEEKKQRLVLLVDGLDEDRGVTRSPDAHSIAALLPAAPPPGVRVIVAGRPDPPVPADVPQRHPLREKNIVRRLSVSPEAQMVRDDAERELGHLLDDRGPGRKLLGLVTVARGGLSRDDLVELSSEPPRTVDRTLRSVLGRTFSAYGTPLGWRRTSPLVVFVLAHEELQQAAAESMSRDELAGFLDKLHAWAGQYHQRDWPAETPEYLLRGYHRLLVATGDIKRMTDMATNPARLDRMLDVTGGDAAALGEITAVQEFICGQQHPDLAALLNLAITRDRLAQRNSKIPLALPAVWARLGNPGRAEALARSIPDQSEQARALAAMAEALAETGDVGRSRHVAEQAEAIARSVPDRSLPTDVPTDVMVDGPWALPEVARALARAGEVDRAEGIARSIFEPSEQAWVLVGVAEALARAGEVDRAEGIARSIFERSEQASVAVAVAEALAEAGDVDRSRHVAQQAEVISRSITDQSRQPRVLAGVAEALARAGEVDRAEAIGRSIADSSGQAWVLAGVAEALARAGEVDRAEAIARSITSPSRQAGALAEALARAGEVDRAEAIARSISSPSGQARALAGVAEALAEAGDVDRSRHFAQQAEGIAGSLPDPSGQAEVLAGVAGALARAGEVDRAEAIARSIADPPGQAWVLAGVAEALARAGEVDRAEAIARSLTDPARREWALVRVAGALAEAGEVDRAEGIARSITDPSRQAKVLVTVAEVLAETGDVDRSRHVVQQAEAIARSITDPSWQAKTLVAVAEVLTRISGKLHKSEYTINSIGSVENDIPVVGIVGTDDDVRLQKLVASALAQTTNYLSLMPLLAKVQPAVVIKFAQDTSANC